MEDYRTIRARPLASTKKKRAALLRSSPLRTARRPLWHFWKKVRAENRTARHNVYAYRLREGNRERYSDDGEPAKTAGTPALEVLQHSGLTDLIVVVTRYFGGVLLGTAAWYGLTPRLRPGHWKMRRSSRCAASLN